MNILYIIVILEQLHYFNHNILKTRRKTKSQLKLGIIESNYYKGKQNMEQNKTCQ